MPEQNIVGACGLRIAMLAPFGVRPKGTVQVRMLPLAQALVRRGHRVQIVAPPVQNPQDAGRCDVYDGVPMLHTARPILPSAAGLAQQIIALLRPVLAQRPDVVHLFKPKGYSGLAALLLRLRKPDLPLVVDTDDWEGWGGWNDVLPYPWAAKMLFAWQERDLPRRARVVTVASHTLETQVWGFGVDPKRVIYLPNGLAPAVLHTARPRAAIRKQHSTVLLYTRFWEFKVYDVVAMLIALLQKRPDTRLLVIGQGERQEERDMLELAKRAGVHAAINYRGWVDAADIPALLASADVAVVPIDDTLINRARCSVKLLEIMAAGVPIVASRVGQVEDYIRDKHNGLLVPPSDPAAMAQAVLGLFEDNALRQRLGATARQSLAVFSWDMLVTKAERAYERALG